MHCKVRRGIDKFEAAEAAALDMLIASKVSDEKVALLLRENHIAVSYQTVRRHRRGLCGCVLNVSDE